MRLEVAKISLEAAKRRFNLATKQLSNAKSKLENAKTQLEAIAAGVKGKCSGLEEENAQLRRTVSEMEKDKLKVEAEKKESGMEIQRLKIDISEMKNGKEKLENELNETRTELERVKSETRAELERVKSETEQPEVENFKLENPKVYFDISIRGGPVNRIVMELYADTPHRKAEIFRSLCTGEKGVNPSGKPLHYKGTSITFSYKNYCIEGGDIIKGNYNQSDSVYGGTAKGEMQTRKHSGPGDVSMVTISEANCRCSFLISTRFNSHWDVAEEVILVGKVIEGMNIVHAINDAFPNETKMSFGTVQIVNSGQISR